MALPLLPFIGSAVGIGKGIASGIKSLGAKKTTKNQEKIGKTGRVVPQKGVSMDLPSISPTYHEKPKDVNTSTSTTGGGTVKSVKMTAENIKSLLLGQDKSLKKLKSDNAKLEKEKIQREKRRQAVSNLKSGLKSVGSKITAPIKAIGKFEPMSALSLLAVGILVNSIQGIIGGIRNYYDENVKPKVDFVNEKVKQFNEFVNGTDSELDKIDKQKGNLEKQIEKLKKDLDDADIEGKVNKLEKTMDKSQYENLNEDQLRDKLISQKNNLSTFVNNSSKSNNESLSFSKVLADNSELSDSQFFDENISKEIVYVYQERIVEMEV